MSSDNSGTGKTNEPVPASERNAVMAVMPESEAFSFQATPSSLPVSSAASESDLPESGPTVFNLMYSYPEGADHSDPLQSYGGMAFRNLFNLDADWYSDVLSSSDRKPEEVALHLERSRESILGKYNVLDDAQNPADPNSWVVGKWGNIRIDIEDGNGNKTDASFNAKQILAMASVYTYYHDRNDYDSFTGYAEKLWNSTRSYRVSMGDVYYDSGCITEEKKAEAVLKRNSPASASEAEAVFTNSDASGGGLPQSEAAAAAQENKAGPTEVLSGETAQSGSANESEDKNNSADFALENTGTASSSDAATLSGGFPACPGHIDLSITAVVYGMEGTENLFTKDKTGNSKSNFNDSWHGWTKDKIEEAKILFNADWYKDYNISVSDFSMRTPLSEGEISHYLNGLPENIPEKRKTVIDCALRSVGRIPYYFGGKPSYAGMEKNHFYKIIEPDYKGRIFKGLDCSGWVSWVYWTALGNHLPVESTSGLISLGHSVRKEELQPGDIIIRAGDPETIGHVMIFLKWNDDGTAQCIHETGGKINNAAVSDITADWNYRNLID